MAGAGLLAAGLLAGCYFGATAAIHHYRTRVIGVCVNTDFEYREEKPNWQASLRPLFAEVNRKFQGTGVQWQIEDGGEAYPPETKGNMAQRAAGLAENSGCKADVILGLTGRRDANSLFAPPFSHVVLIEDSAANDQATTATLVARALARLFGVAGSAHAMMLTEASTAEGFDAADIRTIRSQRDYDFARGIAALTGATESGAASGLAQALAGKLPHPDAEAQRILARAFTAARQHDDAVRHLREAVRLDPGSPEVHVELALALQAASLSDQAIAELKSAVKLDPNNAWPHAAMGVILLNKGRVDEAIDEFQAATRLDPKNASYQSGLGQAYARQPGRIHEAAAAFEAAVRLQSADAWAQAGLTREAGVEQTLLERVNQAEAEVKQNPASAEAYMKLALAHAYAGDPGTARQEVERSLQLKPQNGTAHLVLARLDYMSGQFAAAASELDAARAAGARPTAAFADAIQRKLAPPAGQPH